MVSFLPAGTSTEAALLRTPFRRVAPILEVTDASALFGRFFADGTDGHVTLDARHWRHDFCCGSAGFGLVRPRLENWMVDKK